MPYPDRLLNSYEQKVVDLHPHWWYFFEPAASLIAAVVVTIFLQVAAPDAVQTGLLYLGAAAILVTAGWLAWRYLTWVTTNFVITTDRLIYRHGVFAKSGVEIPLERINNVNFHQSFWERVIGAGDLLIESAGTDGQSRFTDVRHPEAITQLVHAQIEENELRTQQRIRDRLMPPPTAAPMPPPTAAPAPAAGPDVIDQLERLERLRERGTITQAEFEAQKARLLRS
jgi:uncharacterized membrane protein YdbT with pleckstrin-like domain